MIGKKLSEILKEKHLSVSDLSKMCGVNDQTLYSIIKRNNNRIDIQTFFKICECLNVNINRFYSKYENDGDLILFEHEKLLIKQYRLHPEFHDVIDKILDIEKDSE